MLALVTLAIFDVSVFWLPLYRSLLAPDSSTGSFERTLAAASDAARDPQRDILVLGDSRTYAGLDVAVAQAAAGRYRFINAAVSGSTPRVWDVFARALDPDGTRFRAVVIPVDTYGDDDSAIGSEDNDNRSADLRYIALRATPAESARIVGSFGPIDQKIESLVGLTLRAPLVREDVQAFALDPAARIRALGAPLPDLDAPHARVDSLAGLRVDYAKQTISFSRPFSASELAQMKRQLFHTGEPSDTYARYRREWLRPIVARYRASGVPVIFVRIPTRPLHATLPGSPLGSIADFANGDGAQLLPQEPYVSLETPANFADAEHLDRAGARAFSTQLGNDVALAVVDPMFGGYIHRPVTRVAAAIASKAAARREVGHVDIAAVAKKSASLATILMLGTPMQLISYEFAIFFAVVLALVTLLPNERARRALLLLASWYFYARWNTGYLAILLALTALDYGVARGLASSTGARKRVLLACGVGANLAFLGIAKYAGLFSGTVAYALGRADDPWALHLLVPVGISFHTFQSISYIVDVSRGKTRAQKNVIDYALYIAFFPQLLAGPIVRAERFLSELFARRTPSAETFARGLGEIALGVLKKSAIADRFAPIVDAYFGAIPAHPGAPAAWCAVLAFAVQIYFDFSGYTDIAIGCARILGFDFPQNFHRPYLAWSVTEFWRRWHMTLSAWLRDYLYIPLGGNRHGKLATYRNLLITMLLGGLWHGANWTFVAWGAYHGAALAVERMLGVSRTIGSPPPSGLHRIGATLLTVAIVCVGWVFFRAQTFADAFAVLQALVAGGAGPITLDFGDFAIVGLAMAFEIVRETGIAFPARRFVLALATLLALELATYPGAAAEFVYFKF